MFGIDDAALALLVAGGLSTAGALYTNAKNRKMQNQWNDVSVNLANTAHQREVLDLMQAGINPILSAKGSGASVPQLSAATLQNPLDGISDGLSSAAKFASQEYRLGLESLGADIDNVRQNSALQTAQADLVEKQAAMAQMENVINQEEFFNRFRQAEAEQAAWRQFVDEEGNYTSRGQHYIDLIADGMISSAKDVGNQNWRNNLSAITGAVGDVGSTVTNVAGAAHKVSKTVRNFKSIKGR